MNNYNNIVNRQLGKIIFLLVSSAFLLGTLLSGGGCFCGIVEQIAPIQVQNNTAQTLSIYISETYIGDVEPGRKINNSKVWIRSRFNIEAKNAQGEVFYSREFSFDEMEHDMDWTIVIPPPPE
jgi:hypothetical protein